MRQRGKGNVVRHAFAQVEADVYLIADGDGTYDAASAPELVATLWDEQLDMVVGKREHGGERAAYRGGHQTGNRLFNWLVQRLFGDAFADIFSGYRAFSRPFVKSFPALATGFETETEMSLHAIQLGLACVEIPTHYGARGEASESKLRTYRDGVRILWYIARLLKHTRPLFFFASSRRRQRRRLAGDRLRRHRRVHRDGSRPAPADRRRRRQPDDHRRRQPRDRPHPRQRRLRPAGDEAARLPLDQPHRAAQGGGEAAAPCRGLARSLLRFGVVGAIGFAVDGGVMQLLTSAAGVSPLIARAVSFPLALSVTWALNRTLDIRDRTPAPAGIAVPALRSRCRSRASSSTTRSFAALVTTGGIWRRLAAAARSWPERRVSLAATYALSRLLVFSAPARRQALPGQP